MSAVAMLRSARNAAIPFHRLPIELVKGIFASVPTMTYLLLGQNKQVDVWQRRHLADLGELCTLMLVCRQWRDIIIGIQSFWNTVDQAYPQTQTTSLERSGDGPLRVILRSIPSVFMSTLCNNESARIVQIHHVGVVGATAEEHLDFPAPALETLHLTNDCIFGHDPPTETKHAVQLFRGHTPRLRQLSLHNIYWFPVLQTEALTHLDVHMCSWDDFLAKFMGILASASNLTDLVLSSLTSTSSKVASLNAQYPNASVPLLHLRRLHLRKADSEDAVVAMLAKLVLPPTTAFEISKSYMDSPLFSEGALSSLAHLPVMQVASHASIAITSNPLQAAPGPHVTMGQLAVAGAESAVVCTMLSLPSGLATLAPVVPAAQIRELWLVVVSDRTSLLRTPVAEVISAFDPAIFGVDSSTLRHCLRPMAGTLETLVVGGNVLPNVLEALVTLDDAAETPQPLCPKLSTLGLIMSFGAPPIQDLMSLIAARQEVLQLKHVRVNYFRPYGGPRPESLPELDSRFVSVEYVQSREHPMMALPPVCKQEAHARWTPWKANLDGMLESMDGEIRD